MRYLSMVKSAEDQGPPPQEMLEAMGRLAEEAVAEGILVELGALLPTAAGVRMRLSGGKITVSDGPFAEAKEVVGGYAFLEAASREEAIAGAERMLEVHRRYWPEWEGEVEIRPVV
jgi:hypothetical protein